GPGAVLVAPGGGGGLQPGALPLAVLLARRADGSPGFPEGGSPWAPVRCPARAPPRGPRADPRPARRPRSRGARRRPVRGPPGRPYRTVHGGRPRGGGRGHRGAVAPR